MRDPRGRLTVLSPALEVHRSDAGSCLRRCEAGNQTELLELIVCAEDLVFAL